MIVNARDVVTVEAAETKSAITLDVNTTVAVEPKNTVYQCWDVAAPQEQVCKICGDGIPEKEICADRFGLGPSACLEKVVAAALMATNKTPRGKPPTDATRLLALMKSRRLDPGILLHEQRG